MQINDFLNKGSKPVKSKTIRNVVIGAGIGSVVGVAAGMIFAPKAGSEIRQDIKKGTKAAVNTLKDTVNDAKLKITMNAKPQCYDFHYRYSDSDINESFVQKNEDTSDIINDEDSSMTDETFEDRDKCCDD